MITDKEKQIYNSFLITSRQAKNQPFKLRKNFDTLTNEQEVLLKRLSQFFNKYSDIKYHNFFIAPYKVYSTDEYFSLNFYTTRRAIKCYSLYMKQRELESPDSECVVSNTKECIRFIYMFCKTNKFNVDQYKAQINGSTPLILQHLREHKINFYMIHALDCDSIIRAIENDVLNFFIPDFWSIYNTTRMKYLSSSILKPKLQEGLKIIEQELLINNPKPV